MAGAMGVDTRRRRKKKKKNRGIRSK